MCTVYIPSVTASDVYRQLIKLAFDEEVTAESIERLKKLIQRLRAPPTIAELFAFRGQHFVTSAASAKDKQKNATLRYTAEPRTGACWFGASSGLPWVFALSTWSVTCVSTGDEVAEWPDVNTCSEETDE